MSSSIINSQKQFAKLAFEKISAKVVPQQANIHKKTNNLIVLHGLLGSLRNFKSFSRKKEFNTNTNVYLMDLRNHGKSSYLPTMSISELSGDINNFIMEHNLDNTYQLGHSLGGRVAMDLALRNPNSVKGICIVDIGPPEKKKINDKPRPRPEQVKIILENLSKINLETNQYWTYSDIKSKIFEVSPDNARASYFLSLLEKKINVNFFIFSKIFRVKMKMKLGTGNLI